VDVIKDCLIKELQHYPKACAFSLRTSYFRFESFPPPLYNVGAFVRRARTLSFFTLGNIKENLS